MAKEMVVLQGKPFSVDLQSMVSSTNYGWCLTALPQGIALFGMENVPTACGIAPVVQRFWFGAISATKEKVEIEFTLVKLTDMTPSKQKHVVVVTVIPSESEEFAKFSENDDAMVDAVCNAAMPYGLVLGTQDVAFKYGYPVDTSVKYGYPCGVQDATQCCEDACASQPVALKYGIPSPILKYGFPVDTGVKYGYPCGVQDASQCCEDACDSQPVALKYGIPSPTLKYGVPSPTLKYGFPNRSQNVSLIYGFRADTKNLPNK